MEGFSCGHTRSGGYNDDDQKEVPEDEQPNDMIARNEEGLKISSVRTLIEMRHMIVHKSA